MRYKLLLLLFLIFQNTGFATHIVGGEINYTHLGNDSFKIELQLYVDCFNGNPGAISSDQYARIAVFSGAADTLVPELSFEVIRNNPVRVSKTNYNCIKIAPNACVDAYTYVYYKTLPKVEGGYVLSFQRCCRNNSILNLDDPGGTGANFWTKINSVDSITENSSPYFKNLPPNFLCTNTELVFDHSATDADGDSLVYEFFHPYTGATRTAPRPEVIDYETPPFTQINYLTGYDYQNPIDALPNILINNSTGELRLKPTMPGQFVIGIVVKEYRNGVLIGFTQRDYQFNVQNCVFETVSAFAAPDINCDRQVIFNNTSENATSYFWDFGDSTVTDDTSNQSSGTYTYPKVGKYTVMLIAATGNCADTQFKEITIFERLIFDLPEDTIICPGQSVILAPDTFYNNASFQWSDGSTDSVITINTPGKYSLRMLLGNCDGNDSMTLNIDTGKVTLVANAIECNQNVMEYQGLIEVSGGYNTIQWSSDPSIVPNNYANSTFEFKECAIFTVTGLNANNCPYSSSLNVEDYKNIQGKTQLYNTFTPNSDGYNDVFPEEKPNYFYTLTVYNRWGVKVHEEANQPWDGKKEVEGTYFYIIKLKSCDIEEEITGVVTLLR